MDDIENFSVLEVISCTREETVVAVLVPTANGGRGVSRRFPGFRLVGSVDFSDLGFTLFCFFLIRILPTYMSSTLLSD